MRIELGVERLRGVRPILLGSEKSSLGGTNGNNVGMWMIKLKRSI